MKPSGSSGSLPSVASSQSPSDLSANSPNVRFSREGAPDALVFPEADVAPSSAASACSAAPGSPADTAPDALATRQPGRRPGLASRDAADSAAPPSSVPR